MEKLFLGLGKTLFNSSASLIKKTSHGLEIELLLSERWLRQKASGVWPSTVLKNLLLRHPLEKASIAENRDVAHPREIEEYLNKSFPFYEHVERQGLGFLTYKNNQNIQWTPHHLCHASAALLMSPFEKSIIIVMDGAGSNLKDFPPDHPERNFSPKPVNPELRYLEECSVYLQDNGNLQCVKKNWQVFRQPAETEGHWFSEGLGSLYEKSAEYIFNDKRAAGKVMGLAAFGRAFHFEDRQVFLNSLDWHQAFKGKGKKAWDESGKFSLFADIAASVQAHFENSVLSLVQDLHQKYPNYKNLILVGGCALNCTTNMKIHDLRIFDSIYVPPFPGDESIGLGAASYLYHTQNAWTPRSWEIQNGYFGSPDSSPEDSRVEKVFAGFEMIKPASIEEYTASKIALGHIVGWHQGRSETGPRALGNRSILARMDKFGLKKDLNSRIKMREDFRPYGCSVLFERASDYFEVSQNFENPFMSFAVKTRSTYSNLLREVTHYDGTSRMQTVRESQNPRFYKLIQQVGLKTDLFGVLNTSLNVMGEPIVESLEDARNFLLKTDVDGLAIGSFYIPKPGKQND